MQTLAREVEDRPEVGAHRFDEALACAIDSATRRLASVEVRELVGRDRLHLERAEHERQDERRRRVAVVDDDPEAPLAIAAASSVASRSVA